jgi:hypothetical protein
VSTVTGTTNIDPCPYCGTSDGVQPQPAPPTVQAWKCACGLDWAISVVNPHLRSTHLADLAAAADEIARLRWKLAQVIAVADQAPGLTDEQLRTRVVALTSDAR